MNLALLRHSILKLSTTITFEAFSPWWIRKRQVTMPPIYLMSKRDK